MWELSDATEFSIWKKWLPAQQASRLEGLVSSWREIRLQVDSRPPWENKRAEPELLLLHKSSPCWLAYKRSLVFTAGTAKEKVTSLFHCEHGRARAVVPADWWLIGSAEVETNYAFCFRRNRMTLFQLPTVAVLQEDCCFFLPHHEQKRPYSSEALWGFTQTC